jgi:arabinogalactan oligomer/maltooligosaccharide transport system permease protein
VSWRELRKAWLWLLPGAVTLALIAFYPMIYQGAMSLTDFSSASMRDGIQGGVWRAAWQGLTGQTEAVELDPFARLSSTEVHYTGPSMLLALITGALPDLLVFNLLWTGLSVILQTILGVVVALILHRPGILGRSIWRTLFILPWAIPEFIGALIWLRLLEPERGWLAVAQNSPATAVVSGFLDDPNKTLVLLLIAATWYGFPFIMLAATAGLKLISGEVYEAAAIDGAGSWRRFRHITWPLLFPLVMPAILIRSIFAFNQFYLFYAMRVGFPTQTFATLSYNLFAPGYMGGRFAVSAAVNVFTVFVLVILILWFNRLSRATEGVTYA